VAADRLDFVVHRHHVRETVHWDLMLLRPHSETDTCLATWQVPVPPIKINLARPVEIRAIPDHRRAFLQYEGAISPGRGRVRIFDRGRYDLVFHWQTLWLVQFTGTHLVGTFWIKKTTTPDMWILAKCGALR